MSSDNSPTIKVRPDICGVSIYGTGVGVKHLAALERRVREVERRVQKSGNAVIKRLGPDGKYHVVKNQRRLPDRRRTPLIIKRRNNERESGEDDSSISVRGQ